MSNVFKRSYTAFVFCLVAVLSTACGEEDSVVEVGIVELHSDPLLLDVPAVARVGEALEVVVTTYGDGCVSEETTQVEMSGDDLVTITPFDRRIIPSDKTGRCPAILRKFPHRAELMFTTPGTKTVLVRGRKTILFHHTPFDVEHERQVQVDPL
jgi:hypothetical protein